MKVLTQTALAAALICAAPSVNAQQIVPNSCEPFLVVQMENCVVTQHLTCGGGDSTLSVMYIEQGPVVVSRYNDEFQWLDTLYLFSQEREELTASVDPASLTELLETGEDSYVEVIDVEGPSGRRTKTIDGFDRLTGESVIIDGEELLRTEFAFEVSYSDDTPGYRVAGRQFVMAEDRLFLAGIEERVEQGQRTEADYSPRSFARPGDLDFDDLTPRFGCNTAEIGYRP